MRINFASPFFPTGAQNPGNVCRREFLWRFGGGLGGIALAHLLGQQGLLAGAVSPKPRADLNGGIHHRAKVKRIVQLFMNGGASQMDTFDYKPELTKRHGQKFDPGERVEAATSTPGNLMKSPFEFQQHGQCGRWVSSALPRLAECVDDIAFLMAMASKTNVHGPASYMMNTGFLMPGFPCLGAWISYAVGSLSDNLPTFVVMPDPKGLPYNQKGNLTSGFLPVTHQGTIINASSPTPIADLFPPPSVKYITKESERDGLALLNKLNREHLAQWPGDSRLDGRIASYELAAKMQLSAPAVLDISSESDATRNLYGLDEKVTEDFGRRCLIARRMLERGVRFVQIWSGADNGFPRRNWDSHENLARDHGEMAAGMDKPAAALIKDLKSRGLLHDTMVFWTTEFGRMPCSQGAKGRDHNPFAFTVWMAGGGIKGGVSYGASDEWSYKVADKPAYCYDLHATMLHLLGIDHKRLTYRHNGIDRRITDVFGEVIRELLS